MLAPRDSPMNILTLDIEDWLQSSPRALAAARRGESTTVEPSERSVSNTMRLLRILADFGAQATCFILGSLARSYPGLVREIRNAGHEVAIHGYLHRPVYLMSPEEFRADLLRAREVVEQAAGVAVQGYRAPYFSITPRTEWALSILADIGLRYDSSVFPVNHRYYRVHEWNGKDSGPRFPYRLTLPGGELLEIPATTLRFAFQNLPAAGGAFLGFLPPRLLSAAIRQANRLGHPAVFYLHPHDLDAAALRVPEAGETLRGRFSRHGLAWGRSATESRLRFLLQRFGFSSAGQWIRVNRDRLPSFSTAIFG